MYITQIEPGRGKHYKVFGDNMFLFALYGRELKRYHIEEHTDIEDAVIDLILKEVILKRAKERALFLLERKPYTSSMMKDKLHSNDYPEETIEQVILFLEKYHYLDDAEYTRMYVETYSVKKSRKQMTYDLIHKGISKDIIDSYFADFEYSETACFQKQFERYIRGKDLKDRAVRQKVFRYLYGKGFPVSLIEDSLRHTLEIFGC